MKPKAEKTGEHRKHLQYIASLGCVVCGAEATVHHVTSDGLKRISRSHERVAPLCPEHHLIQHGPRDSVEALGHAGFERVHGINLLEWADAAWKRRSE